MSVPSRNMEINDAIQTATSICMDAFGWLIRSIEEREWAAIKTRVSKHQPLDVCDYLMGATQMAAPGKRDRCRDSNQ